MNKQNEDINSCVYALIQLSVHSLETAIPFDEISKQS